MRHVPPALAWSLGAVTQQGANQTQVGAWLTFLGLHTIRAQLNPLLVLPSQQLSPSGTGTPRGDPGTGCRAKGAGCSPAPWSPHTFQSWLHPCRVLTKLAPVPWGSGLLAVHLSAGTPGAWHSTLGCILISWGWGQQGRRGGCSWGEAVTTPAPAPHGCPGCYHPCPFSQPLLLALFNDTPN